MSFHSFRKTLAAACLAVALAAPAHALLERAPEPFRMLLWLKDLWSIVWEGATGTPDEPPPVTPNGEEGHGLDPNG